MKVIFDFPFPDHFPMWEIDRFLSVFFSFPFSQQVFGDHIFQLQFPAPYKGRKRVTEIETKTTEEERETKNPRHHARHG